ncbi:MAG: HD-GYP domain-containing protein [Spirochaetales bacterium]|jgi:HD-GYP domain-containing protein (c-di-GMP phosphodiesterase class II)|nr:HD-GYP domain-containing protein [Spirochaetales bacterium]
MNKLEVKSLKPGIQFSKAVYVDDENLLVPAEVELRQKDLDRLEKWGIEFVLTEGSVLDEASALRKAADTVQTAMAGRGDSDKQQLYKTSVIQVDRIFDEIRINKEVEKKEIDRIVDKLIKATMESPDEMIAFVLRNERSEPSFGLSAVNTVILSILVGSTLKMDQVRTKTLASAALLHDIGMVKVPDEIIKKNANLSIDEIKKMRTHTLYSYKIIAKEMGFSEEVGLIALQHHERWDGKGYPRQLSGKNIAVEARIVSVVDAFEAMVKEKPYRNSMIAYSAMRQLLNDNSRRFDSEILKIFIKSVGIYPLGSFVILNNGIIGRVIKVNENAPLRPAVRLLVDKTGKKFENDEGKILDLINEKEIFIAKAIDPNAISAKKMI